MLPQEARPTTLDQVFGNKPATIALRRAIQSDKKAHVYLFIGPSGCGKTTLARIFATAVGTHDMDVIEINAASQRGIDMAREIERYAASRPFSGGPRTVILDEAQALTKDAQGALLKVLEETPDFAYYCLCTTDPQKLLPTIKTRCEKIAVEKIDEEETIELLLSVAERMGMTTPPDDVMLAIAEASEGCPREALGIFERQVGLDHDDALDVIRNYWTHDRTTKELCQAMVDNRLGWNQLLGIYKKLEKPEPENIRLAVLGYLAGCVVRQKGTKQTESFVNAIEELLEPTYNGGKAQILAGLFRAKQALA